MTRQPCDNPRCETEIGVLGTVKQADTPLFAMTWYDPDERVYPDESANPATGVFKTEHFCSKSCLDEYLEVAG